MFVMYELNVRKNLSQFRHSAKFLKLSSKCSQIAQGKSSAKCRKRQGTKIALCVIFERKIAYVVAKIVHKISL